MRSYLLNSASDVYVFKKLIWFRTPRIPACCSRSRAACSHCWCTNSRSKSAALVLCSCARPAASDRQPQHSTRARCCLSRRQRPAALVAGGPTAAVLATPSSRERVLAVSSLPAHTSAPSRQSDSQSGPLVLRVARTRCVLFVALSCIAEFLSGDSKRARSPASNLWTSLDIFDSTSCRDSSDCSRIFLHRECATARTLRCLWRSLCGIRMFL